MDAPEQPRDEEGPEKGTVRPRRRRWKRKVLLSIVLLGLAAGILLVKSGDGQRLVLNAALSRVRGSLAGELVVDDIRSSSLLGGATLVGVHLGAADGRPFLRADSLRVRYSILGLLAHVPRIASLTVWGLAVDITRLAGESDMNVAHLLASDSSSAGGTASTLRIALASVRVEGGTVQVLTPAGRDLAQGTPTVPSPDGKGRLRRLGLDSLSLELRDVVLTPGAPEKLTGRLTSLSTDVFMMDKPLRVVKARGDLKAGDAGIRLEDAEVELPASTLDGTVTLGPRAGGSAGSGGSGGSGSSGTSGDWGFNTEMSTKGSASLSDFAWLDARIPRGTVRGGIGVTVATATDVEFRKVHIELEASRLDVDGRVAFDERGVQMRNLQVDASPLAVQRLDPWMGRAIPVRGWLSGHATFSGRPDALTASGRVTLVPTGHGGRPTTADFDGTLHVGGDDPGVTNLKATVDPLNFDVLDAMVPRLVVPGAGRATMEATGRVDEGIRLKADIVHMGDSIPDSHVVLEGTVRRAPSRDWELNLRGDLLPLSLSLLAVGAPSLELHGPATGSVHAEGSISALHVTGDLQLGHGTLTLDGTVNAAAPARGYRLSATLDGVRASEVVGALPDPSVMSGRLTLDGSGLSSDSLRARGSLVAFASRIGGLHVDSVTALASAAGGHLTVDTLDADLGGMRVWGSGGLGLVRGSAGEARLSFHTDSLLGLRSVFLGDSVKTRDGLSSLELEFLRMQGVDPDTLPTRAEVAMSGSLDGNVTLSGSLPALAIEGTASLRSGVFGGDTIEAGDLGFWARRALSADREVHATVDMKRVNALGRAYERIRAQGSLEGRSGSGRADVERDASERYMAVGDFSLGATGGVSVAADTLTVKLDSLTWRNMRPVQVAWDSAGVTVHELDFERPGADPMHLSAEGTLAWRGTSDFQVDIRGLQLDRVGRVVQREDLGLGGRLDLGLRLTGPAVAPVIDGSFAVTDPRYSDLTLSQLAGEVHYRDGVARVRLDADEDGRRVLDASGSVPVNLALHTTGSRVTSNPMDVQVRADSMEAAVALSYLSTFQDVTGTVSGTFHIGGTLNEPEPSGVLRLSRAAWSVPALGVRHTDVAGSLTLKPDRTVLVALTGHTKEGSSTVDGTVTLAPARDPALDLKIDFHNFQAVNRQDVNGSISGEVHLGGTYRLPVLKGDLTVDHSNLFVEEFARSADVVDLSDPRIFDVVDTTSLEGRPLLTDMGNPFMDNLRVEVNLSVPRDSWLRSADMNVEMGGSLLVRYDRSKRDIVMVGELQALRGSYSVLGRRFTVQQGTVGFIGTPGINPTLNIQAVAQVRRVQGDALNVTATVTGNLAQPKVNLTSDEQGVAESDLVSYLIFGRPSYELAAGQAKYAGAAGTVLGAAASAGVTYLSGTLATRLGSALSRQVGIDYLSITQAGDFGVATGSLAGSALNNTQVEVGQYWGNNVFFVLVFRPRPEAQQSIFAGARAEVALSDNYSVQGYWEARFLRSGVTGFGDLAGQASRIVGVFIFRDWGY